MECQCCHQRKMPFGWTDGKPWKACGGNSGLREFRLRRGDKLPRFLDHWGRTMTRGGHAIVAELYFTAMTEEQWEEVRRFAIKYDLKYMVLPNSYHFPGQTLRIVFWNEDWCLDAMPVAAAATESDQ
jgi:hypothetical protein